MIYVISCIYYAYNASKLIICVEFHLEISSFILYLWNCNGWWVCFFFFHSIVFKSLFIYIYQYKFKRFGFLLLAIYFRVLTAMFWIRTRVCTNFYLYAWTKIVSSLNFISRKNIIIQLGSKTLAGHLWYSSVGFCRFVNFFFLCKVLSTELVFSPVRSNKSE